jgi:hypothetical protein
LADLPVLNITAQSLAEAARGAMPLPGAAELSAWTERQVQGAQQARHAARRVRRLTRAAANAVEREDPRATTRAFAKLDDAERTLRMAVATSPFVDAYSWRAVDAALLQSSGDSNDSLENAQRALATEAGIARAIETSTAELEQKLEQLLQSFGASAP